MARLVYLVSGEGSLAATAFSLRRRHPRVLTNGEVDSDAWRVLQGSSSFVVVAHGHKDGTVTWHFTGKRPIRWLWVGMPAAPSGVRIYLYCCFAGRRLPRFLKGCEVFGHVDQVPIPRDRSDRAVFDFLNQVDNVMRRATFDRAAWRGHLASYVRRRFAREVEKQTSVDAIAVWRQLLLSLGRDAL